MKIFFYFLAVLVFAILYLRHFEYKNIYFPTHEIEVTPKDAGLSYEEADIATADGLNLKAWFIPAEGARRTLMFFHGNGGNISHRLDKIRLFHNLGMSVFIFDYRGYGLSGGRPSEGGFYRDSGAAYRYLTENKNIAPENIIFFGESLGSAPAVDLAAREEIGALIVEGAFSSIRDMGKRIYPFIPAFVYMTKFDSESKIKNIKCPKLFFHSPDDEMVPFDLGRKLFDAAAAPKQFIEISGSHNDAFFNSANLVVEKIKQFLHQY
ncbi:MAG: alpha/beta hydrolase [Candidatus Omnitrophica bacterium CG11_big_fil_rev_8_21_14_0_20_42_13]|uniref:Alpha/beta hydrolase n=1 Tax=Candidatus Ghiorseimicrobium undicola TaxID=1974746 RepID=A0A2H0LWY3_9BACT|nr:MAG: alpha/beta hydrolase [Candidatus Omnitrophica bacterium CG11_big_fil_rev_8_21_14_0_20_42_13]